MADQASARSEQPGKAQRKPLIERPAGPLAHPQRLAHGAPIPLSYLPYLKPALFAVPGRMDQHRDALAVERVAPCNFDAHVATGAQPIPPAVGHTRESDPCAGGWTLGDHEFELAVSPATRAET